MPRSRKRWSRPAPPSCATRSNERPQDGDRGDDEHQLDQRRNARHPAHAGPCGQARQGGGQHRRQAGGATTTRLRRLRAPAPACRATACRAGSSRRRRTAAPARSGASARVPSARRRSTSYCVDCVACRSIWRPASAPPIAPSSVSMRRLCASPSSLPRIGAGDRAADRADDAAARRRLDRADRLDDGAVAARRGLGRRRRRERRRPAAQAAGAGIGTGRAVTARPAMAPASPVHCADRRQRHRRRPVRRHGGRRRRLRRARRRRPTAPFPWREAAARRGRRRRPRRSCCKVAVTRLSGRIASRPSMR